MLTEICFLGILADYSLFGCKDAAFPMESTHKLRAEDSSLLEDPSIYWRLIGCMIYLTTTIPDLAYFLQALSQFMAKHAQSHLNAAYRVLRYIKATPNQGLFFPFKSDSHLKACSENDSTGCIDIRRTITGFAVFLDDSLVS